jgi:hypothetical protein
MWRDERPAHGENGTYNDYAFVREAERIIDAHPKSKPLFIYQAFQNVHVSSWHLLLLAALPGLIAWR